MLIRPTLTIEKARVVQMPVLEVGAEKVSLYFLQSPSERGVVRNWYHAKTYLVSWTFRGFESHTGDDATETSSNQANCSCDGSLGAPGDVVGLIGQNARDTILKEPDSLAAQDDKT